MSDGKQHTLGIEHVTYSPLQNPTVELCRRAPYYRLGEHVSVTL